MENLPKNIVVIGAGYGGITAVLRLARLLGNNHDYHVHLIDKNPYHTLKTQLHEAAVRKAEVAIPIDSIIRGRNIIFHLGEVTSVNPGELIVYMKKSSLPFSYLILALGSQVNFYGIPGLQEYALALQTLQDAQRIYDHITRLCAQSSSEPNEGQRRNLLRFVIGGGGLSGIEFAAELADYMVKCLRNYNLSLDESEIFIVEAGKQIVPQLEKSFTETIQKELNEKGVNILTYTKIVNQSPDAVTLSSGAVLKTKTLIWTGGVRISELMQESGMKVGQLGRVIVNEFLQAESFPYIYAIGDNALAINLSTRKPVPAAAQFALQQGRLAADNICANITGNEKKQYQPKVWGEVVSLGRHLAVGWMALPFIKKITFVGFIGNLLKAAIQEKHILLLRRESRNWITY